METLLILTYSCVCWVIFKIFKIPVNKWSLTTVVLGGVVMLGTILAGMAYFHPASIGARSYFLTTPIATDVRGKVIEVNVKGNTPIKQGDVLFNLAAGLFVPLYTGGAIEAEVENATAGQKEAIAAYGQAALNAFKEVETALASEEYLLKREEYLKSVVEENYKAYELTKKQFDIGKIDLLDVLTIQGKWVQARIALTDVATQRLLNRVGLHLALGGSFE